MASNTLDLTVNVTDLPKVRRYLELFKAIRDEAAGAHAQWTAWNEAADAEPYATSEWVSGEFGNLEEHMAALKRALDAYDAYEQG